MTPDVYTNLRVLNATNFPLEPTNIGSYQMQSWFPGLSLLAGPQSYSPPYFLQFQRGGGDEDDAGQINMNINSQTIVFLYAGSTPESGHYMQVTLTSPGTSLPLVVGLATGSDWPLSSELSSFVSWYVPPPLPGQVVGLGNLAIPGIDQGPNKAIAIVDLSQIYSQADADTVQNAIAGNTLTSQQAEDLWAQVSNYTHIVESS